MILTIELGMLIFAALVIFGVGATAGFLVGAVMAACKQDQREE